MAYSLETCGFCDLAVDNSIDFKKFHLIEKLGYKTIAVNTFVEESNDEPKKKKKKGEVKEKLDYIPPPSDITISEDSKLKILQRLTIEFSDSSITHKLNKSENFKKYDVIAVIPKTLSAFQYACSSMDIDIISFNPENRMPFKINRKLYNMAVDKGIFFELMYSPAIKDSTARKNIITTAHLYHTIGKSKNLIITSNADNYNHIRGVYDVINLGFILGLDSNQSLEAIRSNTRDVILRSKARKSGRLYVDISVDNDNKNAGG